MDYINHKLCFQLLAESQTSSQYGGLTVAVIQKKEWQQEEVQQQQTQQEEVLYGDGMSAAGHHGDWCYQIL